MGLPPVWVLESHQVLTVSWRSETLLQNQTFLKGKGGTETRWILTGLKVWGFPPYCCCFPATELSNKKKNSFPLSVPVSLFHRGSLVGYFDLQGKALAASRRDEINPSLTHLSLKPSKTFTTSNYQPGETRTRKKLECVKNS